MNFLLGSIFTVLFLSLIFSQRAIRSLKKTKGYRIKYSQTHIHYLIKPLLPSIDQLKLLNKKKRQTTKHIDKTHVKVIIMDGLAYWTKNNVFWVAEVIDGSIDKDSAEVVDTMGMDKVELDKMLFIIDQLKDGGEDDSSSTEQ